MASRSFEGKIFVVKFCAILFSHVAVNVSRFKIIATFVTVGASTL